MQFRYVEKCKQIAYITSNDTILKYSRNIDGKIYTIEQNIGDISYQEFRLRIKRLEELDNTMFIMFNDISKQDD